MSAMNIDKFKKALVFSRRLRAAEALIKLQKGSVKWGKDKMTLDGINAEIVAARTSRS